MSDVTVQSNEHLPKTDVKTPHNEWYAISWEKSFGNQVDEAATKEATDSAPLLESPHIRPRSPPTATVVGYNQRKVAKYNWRPNSKPNTKPDCKRLDAISSTQKKKGKI